MSLKTFATLALAASCAIAKPVHAPQKLPAYPKRNNNGFGGGNGGDAFDFINGFQNFNQQEQVVQIKEENLQIVDNGRQQAVVQQVNEVLIVDQQQNGRNRDMNNLFRKSNFRNNNRDVATVMLVVQEIQVSVDDGRGGQFQQQVFAQSAVVANRGARETQSVMIFEKNVLIAQDVLGGRQGGQGGGVGGVGVGGVAGATGNALPTKTQDVQLLGAKPTWSSVAEDPAASLGGVWQAEMEDLQKAEQDAADNQANADAAAQEKQGLDEAAKQQEEAAKQQEEQAAAEQQNQDQAAAEGENADQAAQDQAAQDKAAQDQAAQEAEGEKDQETAAAEAAGEEVAKGEDSEAAKQE